MNEYTHMRLGALILVLVMVWLSGCAGQTPPSRFYVLTPMAATDGSSTASGLTVGVGPIRLAGYLDRPQIVAREGPHQLRVDEFDRWGGNLEQNIADVVAENLSRLLDTEAVVTFPWNRSIPIDFQVALDVRRLDSGDDRRVHLVAQWRLFEGDARKLLKIERSEIAEPVATGDGGPPAQHYNAQTAAQSRAFAQLSEEIAKAIRELAGR